MKVWASVLSGVLLLVLLVNVATPMERPQFPPKSQWLGDRFFGCTQPFYPEMYVSQYATGADPTDTTLNVFGLALLVPDTSTPRKSPPMLWIYLEPGEGGGIIKAIETIPDEPVVTMTGEELKAKYGFESCGLFRVLTSERKTTL